MSLSNSAFYKKVSAFNSPLVMPWFPWFWFRNDETRLRKLKARWIWINERGFRAKLVVVLKSLIWPCLALLAHLMDWAIHGAEIKRVFKVGIISQLRKRLWFLVWRGYGTVSNYIFYFYEYGKDADYDRFLSLDEVQQLNIAIVVHVDSEVVDDKLKLYLRFKELGIGMVPVYAVFEKGRFGDKVPFHGFPKEDLYLKLATGIGGRNIERWKWSQANNQWSCMDRTLSETALLEYFKKLSETGTYILQPSAKHHPWFDDLTEGGLCTLRVLSICSVDRQVEIVHNYVCMPSGDSPTNHGPRGGLKTKMNLQTHCLENLVWTTPQLGVSATHPVTGKMVKGKRLDCWPEVEAFVKAAHLELSDCFSIAWDLVYSPDGIQILEGNTQWGLINGCFIGESHYPEWYMKKLKSDAGSHVLLDQLARGL